MTDQAYNTDLLVTLGVPGSGQTRALLKPIETILSDAPRAAREHFLAATKEALRLDAAPIKPTRKPQAVRVRPPDALRTPAEAATKLGCSVKTLNGHVASGALRCVDIGHGRKRRRIRFADADLDQFIANQTRKDVPCPSTSQKTAARRISTSTSKCEVIGFTARRNARRAAKPKR